MFKNIAIILTLLFVLLTGFAHAKATYGSVKSSKLNIYAKASSRSEVVGLLGRGSSVEILSSKSGWLKIKLLDGGTGYVKASGIRASNEKPKDTPKKETETKKGETGKEIDRILNKFNSTVEKSNFAKKEKVVPKLILVSSKSNAETVLMYSAVDENGEALPSLKKNLLAKNMRELITLIFRKMIVDSAPEYKITIMVPSYGMGGKVRGEAVYADLVMKPSPQELQEIKEGTTSLWTVVRSTRKLGDVFAEYPR